MYCAYLQEVPRLENLRVIWCSLSFECDFCVYPVSIELLLRYLVSLALFSDYAIVKCILGQKQTNHPMNYTSDLSLAYNYI